MFKHVDPTLIGVIKKKKNVVSLNKDLIEVSIKLHEKNENFEFLILSLLFIMNDELLSIIGEFPSNFVMHSSLIVTFIIEKIDEK